MVKIAKHKLAAIRLREMPFTTEIVVNESL